MSFAALLDHEVRIWARQVTLGRLREEIVTYTAQTTLVPGACRRPTAPVASIGAGLDPVGERVVYLPATASLQPRDLVELVTGPEAPNVLEVNQPPTRPRGHHTELSCRFWHGTLP